MKKELILWDDVTSRLSVRAEKLLFDNKVLPLDFAPRLRHNIHMVDDSPPRLGDLVKMKIDEDRGVAGVIHKVRALTDNLVAIPGGDVYHITWPDGIQSIQYKSEIRVISRS
jgi:hypothetical protein